MCERRGSEPGGQPTSLVEGGVGSCDAARPASPLPARLIGVDLLALGLVHALPLQELAAADAAVADGWLKLRAGGMANITHWAATGRQAAIVRPRRPSGNKPQHSMAADPSVGLSCNLAWHAYVTMLQTGPQHSRKQDGRPCAARSAAHKQAKAASACRARVVTHDEQAVVHEEVGQHKAAPRVGVRQRVRRRRRHARGEAQDDLVLVHQLVHVLAGGAEVARLKGRVRAGTSARIADSYTHWSGGSIARRLASAGAGGTLLRHRLPAPSWAAWARAPRSSGGCRPGCRSRCMAAPGRRQGVVEGGSSRQELAASELAVVARLRVWPAA